MASRDIEKDAVSVKGGTTVDDSHSKQELHHQSTRRGVATVVGAFLIMFSSFGQANAFGSYQSWYSQNQLASYSPSKISLIGSLQLWVFFAFGGLVGRLFDAYGPTSLISSGSLILTLSLMLTSISYEYWHFIVAQGLIYGIGFALLFFPAASATATHFKKYKATALGIVMAGSSVGGVIFPIMLQRMFNELGFAWAVRVSGFICLACGIVGTVTVSSNLDRKDPGPWIDKTTLRDATFILLLGGSALCTLGAFVPLYYLAPYAESISIPQPRAYDMLSILNACGFLGRIVPSLMADYLGRFNVLIPSTVVASILSFTLWLKSYDASMLLTYSVLYGFFSGPYFGFQVACVAQISRPDRIGARVGMLYTGCSLFALAGGPIAGAILSWQHGQYSGLIYFSAATFLAGAVLYACVRLRLSLTLLDKV
ncbi:MFS general substrate transporter [Coniophora puteana RWD-64-598 SS2]|uniref:MFS general substrate transporter n=1 Tax=Coniophora puteana (strain RWD-64-598) TaxID=741705 RepID=A0A5M3ML65_CONPW|nr:MFS general substrate transporter [Coniophora puteana RWD-64-598 SS2]EIW79979.1 MFS general substrate transporter [Coniophora puteana RWD-64-598 SS2]